ncbi:MAG: hypothetical protein BAJALOKI2v1_480025 [Promethearchaeota archaeon]|nr:MAG: hypothetical protein BAJALOKI2v1_480025 [Candidatus Lokiarchaeota archaeon]
MRLINYSFKGYRDINGFSKEEILEVRRKISDFRKNNQGEELGEYLRELFPKKILEIYSSYFNKIQGFWDDYLKNLEVNSSEVEFYNLKSQLFNELNHIINNLYNYQLNCQNSKRFLKNKTILDQKISEINSLSQNYKDLRGKLKKIIPEKNPELIEDIKFWVKINKIKNPKISFTQIPEALKKWEEINEIAHYFTLESSEKKRKRNKEESFHILFKDLHQRLKQKGEENLDFRMELIAFLSESQIFHFEDEFKNILERQKIQENLKIALKSFIKKIILGEFEQIIQTIRGSERALTVDINAEQKSLEDILEESPQALLSDFITYYITFLEEIYSPDISSEDTIFNYKEVKNEFSEDFKNVQKSIENIDQKFLEISNLISPYGEILDEFFEILSNLNDEIIRRKEEYIFFLKTLKEENLRDEIRSYISNKISEVNSLIDEYQDKAAKIINEEFPQLTQIREIFKDYKSKIQVIKEEIHQKLNTLEDEDIDIYHNIRQWEENFNKKTKELNYLISILLNKIVKNFKTLIDEETSFFNEISEISVKNEDRKPNIPLNYSLSESLIQTLTEKELKERIAEVKSKINKISKEKELYKENLVLLEETLEKRIKIREGISVSTVQCNICREEIDLTEDKYIKCPFCQAVYHYLCVAFWLEKYNSCPSCQNQFLDPNNGLFETQEEFK